MSNCFDASLVRQYLYCPMAAHYILRGLPEPETERMREGKETQKAEEQREDRRKLALGTIEAEYEERSVYITADGICGIIDMVIWAKGRPIPVEIKGTRKPRRVPLSHRAQATAYAILTEKAYGKAVPKAIIYYAETRDTVTINTAQYKPLVTEILRKLAKITQGHTPEPNQPEKCASCWYRKYCKTITTTKIEII